MERGGGGAYPLTALSYLLLPSPTPISYLLLLSLSYLLLPSPTPISYLLPPTSFLLPPTPISLPSPTSYSYLSPVSYLLSPISYSYLSPISYSLLASLPSISLFGLSSPLFTLSALELTQLHPSHVCDMCAPSLIAESLSSSYLLTYLLTCVCAKANCGEFELIYPHSCER